jgi:hypothetical protein
MKIKTVEFNDEEEPVSFTVHMTAKEAALLYGFTGFISPQKISDRAGPEWVDACYGLAQAGGFFNMFYDDGWNDVGPVAFGAWFRNIVRSEDNDND